MDVNESVNFGLCSICMVNICLSVNLESSIHLKPMKVAIARVAMISSPGGLANFDKLGSSTSFLYNTFLASCSYFELL